MANPIKPTPTLEGEDALRLLEERERRIAQARAVRAERMRLKSPSHDTRAEDREDIRCSLWKHKF